MDQQKCCGQNNINGGGEYQRLNFLYVQLPTSFEEVGGGAFRFEIYFF